MSGRRGVVVPQNTFLDNLIRKTNGTHENFLLASANIVDSPIVYSSEGFTKMTGYRKGHVIKKKADCIFMCGYLTSKDSFRNLRATIKEKKDAQLEILFYKKDGTPFWVLLNVGIVYDNQCSPLFVIITFQDITQYKEAINSNLIHRWAVINKGLHVNGNKEPDNPMLKARQEKNRLHITQLMQEKVDSLPKYKQEIPSTPRFVLLHCSKGKIFWDWCILILVLYTATAVPFIFCFNYDSLPMFITDTVVDFIFLIDIIANFHTSYVDNDGEIVLDLKKIRCAYLKTWFFVDMITSLPYGLLSILISGAGKEITRFISFLKAVRLLRITRIVRALDHYLEYGFITLVLWMLFFCLCSHWMACTFYTIADKYDNFTDVGWVKTMAEQTNQPFLLKVNASRKIESPTLASLYMSALYFSLTSLTSIGFGNVAPNTTAEKIFSCITMIFGGLCYAVIFGQVTAIIQQAQKKSENYQQTLDNMRSFCNLYRIPKNLSTRITDYFKYTWVLNKGVDTNQVLQNCPKDLQSDICIHLNRKIIDSTPAFDKLPNAVLRAVARNFAIHRVAPGERVVHERESLDTLYFIACGSFEVTQKGKVVGLLGEGDVFGDDVFHHNDVGRSVADVFALTYAILHAMDRNDLLQALEFDPEYGLQFAKIFRLSYNLRDEVIMRKLSAHARTTSRRMSRDVESRRYSIVNEIQESGFNTDSNGSSPNSQHIIDTDSPIKPLNVMNRPRRATLGNEMNDIQEENELDNAGDNDNKQRNDPQYSKDISKEFLLEITTMKSEVHHEIQLMGEKMNALEENISTILSILRNQECNSQGPVFSGDSGLSEKTQEKTQSRTANIISRVKSEMPEQVLPDWVEEENFGIKREENENVHKDVKQNHKRFITPSANEITQETNDGTRQIPFDEKDLVTSWTSREPNEKKRIVKREKRDHLDERTRKIKKAKKH